MRIALSILVRDFGTTLICSWPLIGTLLPWSSLSYQRVFSWLFGSLLCLWFCRGDWVHKAEWPQECLLLLEGLVKLCVPCRPALAIHLFNSCHYSLMQSSCCWQESILGANVHPLDKLVQPLGEWHHQWHLWGSSWRGALGHLFSFLCLLSSGAPLVLFLPHGGHIVEQTLQWEESPLLPLGSGPAQVFLFNSSRKIWHPQSPVCDTVGTNWCILRNPSPSPRMAKLP